MESDIQNINSKQEMDGLELGILKSRMTETESILKEKIRELQLGLDRSAKEHAQNMRQQRDTTLKRFDEIEFKQSQIPKTIEMATNEIKRLRNDIDERVSLEIRKVEREIVNIKGALQSRVTEKGMEETVTDAVRSLTGRIDLLSLDIEDIRLEKQREKSEALKKESRDSPAIVPGSFYKPPHLDFGKETSRRTPSPPQEAIDPALESAADEY
jgi:hypothetical protein